MGAIMGGKPKMPAAPAAAPAPIAAAAVPETQVAKVTDLEVQNRKNKRNTTDFSTSESPLGSGTLLGS
jgi:hypothetical protein